MNIADLLTDHTLCAARRLERDLTHADAAEQADIAECELEGMEDQISGHSGPRTKKWYKMAAPVQWDIPVNNNLADGGLPAPLGFFTR